MVAARRLNNISPRTGQNAEICLRIEAALPEEKEPTEIPPQLSSGKYVCVSELFREHISI
jgi:hypothetical protein